MLWQRYRSELLIPTPFPYWDGFDSKPRVCAYSTSEEVWVILVDGSYPFPIGMIPHLPVIRKGPGEFAGEGWLI